jgi:hypothetical protein
MNRATRIKLSATAAAQAHERTTGAYSYAYQCGALESHIDILCRELENFKPRASGRGEREAVYAHDGGELVVYYDLDEPDDEVGYTGGVTVNSVFAHGMDITEMLSGTSVMGDIEEHCILSADQEWRDAEADAAEYAYESRRDEMTGVEA